MRDITEWQTAFNRELEQAQKARLDGKEGLARVCARRAAGIAIRQYLLQHGMTQPDPSAYNQLRTLAALPGLSEPVREVTGHFLVRTNPDYTLPIQADLIQEARWLAEQLLGETP